MCLIMLWCLECSGQCVSGAAAVLTAGTLYDLRIDYRHLQVPPPPLSRFARRSPAAFTCVFRANSPRMSARPATDVCMSLLA